ncbi:MAG: hypoxanthine phosphoribosyltransferase [Acidimicrobiia bacterium]|nr:hypoxanthine phosphoribosyltransferase [Acidimicrobiia bacterium]
MTTDVLIPAERIAERVHELGSELGRRFEGRVPVVVGVLHGTFPFVADLVRASDLTLEVEFLALSRFGEGGRVRVTHDVGVDLMDRDVILVEDIVDTGLTLRTLLALLASRRPASITTVTLLDKRPRRLVEVPVDLVGFEIGDEFVIGYGMDWRGLHRNHPDIHAVLDLAAFSGDVAPARSRAED